MGRWTREEIEDAFAEYQKAGLEAGRTGDWGAGRHVHRGRHLHRAPLRELVVGSDPEVDHLGHEHLPGDTMPHFPIEWYMIDEEKGWVVCQVWNRMADPGDGSLHQAYNFTLLKYAGNGMWSYEEDIYNPASFATMVRGWITRKRELDAQGSQESTAEAS